MMRSFVCPDYFKKEGDCISFSFDSYRFFVYNRAMKATERNRKKYTDRLQAYLMDYTDDGLHRYSVDEENEVFQQITDGDVDAVIARIEAANVTDELTNRVGKMATRPQKSLEYMVCISISLASRAAVRGGMELNAAYTLTDVFLRHLAECRTTDELLSLQADAFVLFAEQVKKQREDRSSYAYIEKAKDYIANHLNERFSLEELAAELNLSPTYLSHRFSAEVGIGIRKYTQKKRIEAAKNMLRFSDVSIERIASYLCFPSQSHFGKVFKEFTGMTPQAFRNWEQTANDPYLTPREL